jgi:hypothetical protein
VDGPGNQSKVAGNIAVFKAVARPPVIQDTNTPFSGGPFTFQWTKVGVGNVADISGVTEIHNNANISTLTIFNVQNDDAGTYLCTVGLTKATNTAVAPNDTKHGVLVVRVDDKIPSANITHPNNNLKTTNGQTVLISASLGTFQPNSAPLMDIDGTAADNGMITNVALLRNEDNLSINVYPLYYKSNAAGLMKPGSVLWTNKVTLKHGTNTYRVVATDTAGLPSAGTAKRQYFFCTNIPVTISVTGTGTVKGVASPFGKPLLGFQTNLFDQIGYKVTAVKTVTSKQFRGWRTNNLPTYVSTSATFSFVGSSNIVITADFDP